MCCILPAGQPPSSHLILPCRPNIITVWAKFRVGHRWISVAVNSHFNRANPSSGAARSPPLPRTMRNWNDGRLDAEISLSLPAPSLTAIPHPRGSGISPTTSPSTSRPTSSNCSLLHSRMRQTCSGPRYSVGAWRIPPPRWEGRIPADWQFLLATSFLTAAPSPSSINLPPPSAHFYFFSPPRHTTPPPLFPSHITAPSLPIRQPFFVASTFLDSELQWNINIAGNGVICAQRD